MPIRHYAENAKVFLVDSRNGHDWRMHSAAVASLADSGQCSSDSLVMRTLLSAARQYPGLDEINCRLVFEQVQIGAALRAGLRKSLVSHGLSESKFSILVTLLSLVPSPAMEADLANHAGVTRSSVTGALDELQEQQLVNRIRSRIDRRIINVHLTKKGRTTIDVALRHYLQTAGRLVISRKRRPMRSIKIDPPRVASD
jgi:DNA-binding MarR family transcriptional regulator